MSHMYQCPRGHKWEDSFGASISPGGFAVCPICGAETEVMPEEVGGRPTDVPKPSSWMGASQGNATQAHQSPFFQPEEQPPTGTAVPGYLIMGELGRGGMGVVYKAKQIGLKRTVALKMVLAGGHASRDAKGRFRAEAEAVAKLQHPNIVQVYEIGDHEGRPFFSMEFVEGGSLIDRIFEEPMPARQTAKLIAQLSRAVHVAHQAGIIHRDLKPANVLITKDGTPKITDFGLAKDLAETEGQTRTGDVMGTPSYMSPEQAEGKLKEIGPGTDIYALGAILYEILTARPPFRAETAMDTLLQVIYEDPVPPTRLVPKLSSDLETICLKCLSKEVRKRYATGLELAEDLERYLDGKPILARPTGKIERALKWARRRPALAGLVTVSSLAAIGLLGGSLYFNVQLDLAAKRERANAEEADRARKDAVVQEQLANQRRQDAETAREHAIKQEQLANKRRDEAERQRLRAERNFQKARDAVKQMLLEVGQSELAYVPMMETVRQRLLGKALAFQKDFLEKETTDPAVRRQTGQANQQLGEIYKMLGKYPDAETNYREAIKRFSELMTEFPKDPDPARDLGQTQFLLGQLLRDRGQNKEAEQAYRDALSIQEKLAVQPPRPPEDRRDLAHTLNDLALILRKTNRAEPAREAYERALKLQEELIAEDPKRHPEYREDFGGSLIDLGALYRSTKQLGQAEKAYQRALSQFDELVAIHPEVPGYRHKLASAYNNLGNVLQELQGPGKALPALNKALEHREKLANDFPSVLVYRQDVANTHNNLAAVIAADGRPADAEKEAAKALEIRRKLVKDYPTVPDFQAGLGAVLDNLAALNAQQNRPAKAGELLAEALPYLEAARKSAKDDPAYQTFLRNHYKIQADSHLRPGEKGESPRHADAALTATELPKRVGDGMDEYLTAAVILARCATVAEKDMKLPETQRKAASQGYAGKSVQMLREAVQRGYIDLLALRKDPIFNSLRGRDDFNKLVSDVEKRG